MKNIEDQEWFIIRPIILKLAKRNYPTKNDWAEYKADERYLKCFICNEDIIFEHAFGTFLHAYEVRFHAFKHLKEKNLLPFI